MKKLYLALFTILIFSCSKDSDTYNQQLVTAKSWRAHFYSKNDVEDSTVVAQQPTFEFRGDGKMYFSQTMPVYLDTLQYEFNGGSNIKLTKPSVNTGYEGNIQIQNLSDSVFDFWITDNQTSDIKYYQTRPL